MHQPTLAKWADLLGPLFPACAEFALKPQLNLISVRWQPSVVTGSPNPQRQNVAIFIAPNAMKDYRNAQDGQRARADRKLFAHVQSSLKRYQPRQFTLSDEPEVRIVVASVDILSR